jgi:hypothetical protein
MPMKQYIWGWLYIKGNKKSGWDFLQYICGIHCLKSGLENIALNQDWRKRTTTRYFFASIIHLDLDQKFSKCCSFTILDIWACYCRFVRIVQKTVLIPTSLVWFGGALSSKPHRVLLTQILHRSGTKVSTIVEAK